MEQNYYAITAILNEKTYNAVINAVNMETAIGYFYRQEENHGKTIIDVCRLETFTLKDNNTTTEYLVPQMQLSTADLIAQRTYKDFKKDKNCKYIEALFEVYLLLNDVMYVLGPNNDFDREKRREILHFKKDKLKSMADKSTIEEDREGLISILESVEAELEWYNNKYQKQ